MVNLHYCPKKKKDQIFHVFSSIYKASFHLRALILLGAISNNYNLALPYSFIHIKKLFPNHVFKYIYRYVVHA
jgi:hypothetical protein